MITARLLTLSLAFAIAPTTTLAFDFKGVALGEPTTPAIISERLGISCGIGAHEWQVCNGATTIAQEPAELNLVIDEKGIVQRMRFSLSSKSFDVVAPVLRGKFGAPANRASVVQNRFGAKFEQTHHSWRNKRGQRIDFWRYAGELDHSDLWFSTSQDRQQTELNSPTSRLSDL